MKKSSNILWGIALILLGVIFTLNALNITDIDVFFDGWWTLFIIVPCTVSLFKKGEKTGNIIGIFIGLFLLLWCQDILEFSMLWKIGVPVLIIIIGLKLLIRGFMGNKSNEVLKRITQSGNDLKRGSATFSNQRLDFERENFQGAELNAIFGGVDCDLRYAVINQDCVINATAVFGGIDIYVPNNINIKVNSTCIFGGIANKNNRNQIEGAPTLYINATCIFAGIDIK